MAEDVIDGGADDQVIDDAGVADNTADDTAIKPVEGAVVDDAGARKSFLDTVDDKWRGDVVAKLGYEGDEAVKMESYLMKYGSIDAALKAGREASVKISKGEISNGKPGDDNADALSAWRAERGIPPDKDGYASVFEAGEFNDIDKNILTGMFDVAHKYDISQDAIKEITSSILSSRERETEKLNNSIRAKDANYDNEMDSILHDAWGNNKDSNMEAARQFINKLPESLREKFTEFRDGEGKGIIHYPELWISLSDAERKINPMGTVVGTSDNAVKTAQAEFAALNDRMANDPTWHKDKQANARWEVLYTALNGKKAG